MVRPTGTGGSFLVQMSLLFICWVTLGKLLNLSVHHLYNKAIKMLEGFCEG